jgi:preprotein translocase subunit SecE
VSQDQDGIDKDRRAAGPDGADEVTDAPDLDATLDDESSRPGRRARRSSRDTDDAADDAVAGSDLDSDSEIVDEDAEPDDGSAPVTAGGSFRAAARRGGSSAVAQATTDKKDAPTRRRDTEERSGLIARIGRFVREVVAELRKVIWPSRKQWATFTFVVIVFLVVMVALVSGLDVLFHLIVGEVFG